MPTLHVCPLSRLHDTVTEIRASHVVTLINVGSAVERPPAIAPERHLFLGVSDIVEPMDGHILPAAEHIERLLAFVGTWERESPLVFHCWAGISRSTAAAFISACALAPERDEAEIAQALRLASPTATPNARFVALADDVLGRRGRMVEAVRGIGRGAEAMEGTPFMLQLSRG
ncbi:tyrosine phosphatase family protein [Microvirga sp. 17 mud 1-3]|uniref:tyrosine phosphatase family protein n=1 Tax=Microvirga sp. 17 mud 1-3 TaxID=2082949 RepID=UPI000D6A8F3F|nr:tyrosine phosphatase family protein [Microvirga sp. 17 mud 1-3]AWM87806.1 protein tyrosine phosphatase [Microvirga sp. 17 mud 1-3]